MSGPIIDVNVNLSHWPFRRTKCDETTELVAKVRQFGVTQAWAGSFDGVLHKDIAGVNSRLAEQCKNHGEGLLIPFGSINPKLPDWEDDLHRCREKHKMPGIRLHPNYHGYKLDDPQFAQLIEKATTLGLLIQIVISMEDERTQHPLMQVPAVDASPLIPILKSNPNARIMLLNAFRSIRAEPLLRLVATGRISFEIATLEGVNGVANLLQQVPLKHVVFGSHAPFFYFESAILKMQESPLTDAQRAAVFSENARGLI